MLLLRSRLSYFSIKVSINLKMFFQRNLCAASLKIRNQFFLFWLKRQFSNEFSKWRKKRYFKTHHRAIRFVEGVWVEAICDVNPVSITALSLIGLVLAPFGKGKGLQLHPILVMAKAIK